MQLNNDPHALKISRWLMKVGFAILMLATAIMIYADLTQESSMASKIFGHTTLLLAYVMFGIIFSIHRKQARQKDE
ncbi:MAG: hypothetical protein COA84_06470 [Robiginitomaculum sp.]|nr:MAG: hypothetical protein COA84_06470 [Robiginitomaculum sp.]